MNIQKYLRGLTAVALFAGMMPAAQAQTADANFNVTVNLTSVCTVSAPISDLAFGAYTAFQVPDNTAGPINVTFTCTRGLAGSATAAFDTATPDATAGPGAVDPVGAGVIQGLAYTMLATRGVVVPGTAATGGAGGTPGSIGTASTIPYQITGLMPGGQAGDPTQNATPQPRTLTLTF